MRGRGACRCARGNLKERPKAWTKMTTGKSGANAPDRNRSPAPPQRHPGGRLKNQRPRARKKQAYNSTCIPISTTRFAGILKNFVLRVELRAMNENTARRQRHSAGFLAATTVCRDRK